jgi:hypothetical protein
MSLLASTPKTYPASLLLNFDGANNSATFTDSSDTNLTITNVGTPTISVAQSKFGGSSGYFNGSSSLTNSSLSLGTSDFTIEAWIYCTALNTPQTIVNQGNSDTTGNFLLWVTSSNKIGFYANNNDRIGGGNTTINLNQWYHIAFTRSGSTYKIFVNGSLDGTYVGGFNHSGSPFKVGDGYGGIRYFNGYIDNLRVTKGVALYQSDYFIPPYYSSSKNATIAPKLYNHIVIVSTKSSENITGNITTSSGYYTVNWYDGTKTTYVSGANFNKTAVGGNQYITIYPSTSNGSLDGYFYNVNVSNNNLISIRPFYSRFTGTPSNTVPGFWTPYQYWWTGNWKWRSTYVPPVYTPGTQYQFDVSSNLLDSSSLNQIYSDLLNGIGNIDVSDNIGGNSDDPSIATSKGYTVFGSVAPYTTLLLNLNNNYTDSSSQNTSISVLGGSPSFSTSIKKYGSAALSFNGGNVGNDSFVIPDLSQVDYTIEFWIYRPTATAAYEGVINLSNGGSSAGINIHLYTSNEIQFNDGQSAAAYGGIISAGSWYHVACVSRNSVKKLFINGTLVSSATQPTQAGPYKIKIGATYGFGQTSNAYIDDLRIIRGVVLYTGDFIVPSSELTTSTSSISAGVSRLLLNFTGTNNSTVFADSSSSNHTVTAYGNAKISTTQSKPSGGSSGYFDGTGDYLDIPYNTVFNLSSGSWTLEAWFYATALPSDMTVSSAAIISKDRYGYSFDYNINVAQNGIVFICHNVADSSSYLFCYTSISTNAWHHVAIVSDGSECRVYLDGLLINSKTFSGNFTITNDKNSNISVGCNSSTNNSNSFFTGYIDDVRIVKGKALYTSNFTPPTSQLTNYP